MPRLIYTSFQKCINVYKHLNLLHINIYYVACVEIIVQNEKYSPVHIDISAPVCGFVRNGTKNEKKIIYVGIKGIINARQIHCKFYFGRF